MGPEALQKRRGGGRRDLCIEGDSQCLTRGVVLHLLSLEIQTFFLGLIKRKATHKEEKNGVLKRYELHV